MCLCVCLEIIYNETCKASSVVTKYETHREIEWKVGFMKIVFPLVRMEFSNTVMCSKMFFTKYKNKKK